MSFKIYTLVRLKKNSRSEISTPFYTLLKSKKGLNLSFFRKRTQNLSFLAKIKLFFRVYHTCKNVTQRIFDKRLCCLYMSVFVWVMSIFFSLFCPLFTCLYKRTHKLSFLVQSKKKVFFF